MIPRRGTSAIQSTINHAESKGIQCFKSACGVCPSLVGVFPAESPLVGVQHRTNDRHSIRRKKYNLIALLCLLSNKVMRLIVLKRLWLLRLLFPKNKVALLCNIVSMLFGRTKGMLNISPLFNSSCTTACKDFSHWDLIRKTCSSSMPPHPP